MHFTKTILCDGLPYSLYRPHRAASAVRHSFPELKSYRLPRHGHTSALCRERDPTQAAF